MKRRELLAPLVPLAASSWLALLPAGAANAQAVQAQAQGGPQEGRHYSRVAKPLPAAVPGKVEVVEFFWYGCPHCYAFEPLLDAWVRQLPPQVSFRKAHVSGRAQVGAHQRLFYALEALGLEPKLRGAVFQALHNQRRDMNTPQEQAAVLAPLGVDAAKLVEAIHSFGVQAKCQQAGKLADAYGIDGVPTLGLGGRFTTSPEQAKGGQRLGDLDAGRQALAVADVLLQQLLKG